MRYLFPLFPGGKHRAVTLSYDDGIHADMHMAEILGRYGMKATFNVCSAFIGDHDFYSSEAEIKSLLDAGHEIAVHGAHHCAPGLIRPIEGLVDVLTCRSELENRFHRIIRGMAYPDSGILCFGNGNSYEQVRNYLKEAGIVYARTLGGDNNYFMLPSDWYAWTPTAHHQNPRLMEYVDQFVGFDYATALTSNRYPRLFYLWGHNYEYDNNNNWKLLERFCKKISGRDDIWYATNIEIYDYVHAYESLLWSVDGSIVTNPTLYKIWFEINGKIFSVESGETLELK